jgi:hypothetical protein
MLRGGGFRAQRGVTREQHRDILEFIGQAVNDAPGPLDVEADAIIRAQFVRNPDAAYRVTMLAMELAKCRQAQAGRAAWRGWLSALRWGRRAPQ